jgi:hypothetical protein
MTHDDDLDIPPFLDRRNQPAPTGSASTAAPNIPALIVRSAARLMQARSSAEVFEAKRLAQAALHYARVTKAAKDTHADCLRIITSAESRMANEVDAAQERGELAKPGRPGKIVRTADNLDLDRRPWKSGVTCAMPANSLSKTCCWQHWPRAARPPRGRSSMAQGRFARSSKDLGRSPTSPKARTRKAAISQRIQRQSVPRNASG